MRQQQAAGRRTATVLRAFAGVGALVCALSASLAFAADFTLRDMAGKTHALSDYRGKWVIVNYWATWCPPCLEEIPDLIGLHEQGRNVVVIGVALDYENPAQVSKFVDDNLMSYPVVLGTEQVTRQIGPSSVLPTTFIYDPKGQLVKTRRGLVTRKYLEKVMAGG